MGSKDRTTRRHRCTSYPIRFHTGGLRGFDSQGNCRSRFYTTHCSLYVAIFYYQSKSFLIGPSANLLPPPQLLDIPIVRLMTHPSYLDFQSQIATLSLISQLHIKFLPPDWDAPTPQTPFPGSPNEAADTQQLKEWKRRIKMYRKYLATAQIIVLLSFFSVAPVIEAFGSERIIYGSSPSSSSSRIPSNAGDWYEIARESLVETGIEQVLIDNLFHANADRVYAKRSEKK